jgi:hypothetical protein
MAVLFPVLLSNITNYYVAFRLFDSNKDAAVSYHTDTEIGILAPHSVENRVTMLIKKKEPDDTQYNDNKLLMWMGIVSEGVKASDLNNDFSLDRTQCNLLPIIVQEVISIRISLTSFLPVSLTSHIPSKREI